MITFALDQITIVGMNDEMIAIVTGTRDPEKTVIAANVRGLLVVMMPVALDPHHQGARMTEGLPWTIIVGALRTAGQMIITQNENVAAKSLTGNGKTDAARRRMTGLTTALRGIPMGTPGPVN